MMKKVVEAYWCINDCIQSVIKKVLDLLIISFVYLCAPMASIQMTAMTRGHYTEALTHRSLYTEDLLDTERFTQRNLLHKGALTHRCIYTQKLLHTDVFPHRSFYAHTFFNRGALTHRKNTQKSLCRGAFSQRSFNTQKLLRNEVFTQTSFDKQTPLYTKVFTHRRVYAHTRQEWIII